jgi:hypothetical protein
MIASPFIFCTVLWAILFAGFYGGPFVFHPMPSADTLIFLLACVALFVVSSVVGYVYEGQRLTRVAGSPIRYVRFDVDRVVLITSVFALGGTACIVVDRLALQGFLGLAGLTEIRYERAEDVLAATAISRGILTYFGYLLYPALYLVVAIGICYYEGLRSRGKLLLTANMIGPCLLAVLFGGRSPILVLFLIIVASCVVRRLLGLRAFPAGASLKVAGVVGILGFILYTNLIWFQRLELSASTVNVLLEHAEKVWGIEPSQQFESWLAGMGKQDLMVPLLGAWFYLFQGPSILERLITVREYPVLFGGHHIDIVAAGFRLFPATRTMLADGYASLLQANVYGFFPTAWGSLLIDFSFGAFPLIALWGAVCGTSYMRLRRDGRPGDAIYYVFLVYSIMISPISAPFGLANSFVIFLHFFGFKLWLMSTRKTVKTNPA